MLKPLVFIWQIAISAPFLANILCEFQQLFCQFAISSHSRNLLRNRVEWNLINRLFNTISTNLKSCNSYNLETLNLTPKSKTTHFLIHISSLQAHFDELNDLLLQLPYSPCIIFSSETRINVALTINVNTLGYTFVHNPSPTKAGGVGAYISTTLNFKINDDFCLQVQGCEDLWIDIELSNHKTYTFSVIYRHPQINHRAFFEALDKRMFMLKKKKCLVLRDISIDLNPKNVQPVTSTPQSTIDHIFTNDYESIVTPGVLTYSLSDHYPIFVL